MKRSWVLIFSLLLQAVTARERLEPNEGCYFGITVTGTNTVRQVREELGITPAVYLNFYEFPLTQTARSGVEALLHDVAEVHGIAMLTLEAWSGLPGVTINPCVEVAELCAAAEQRGIAGIFIRFGHEMNGNWYPWGQRPALFKSKFRLLAETIHARTRRTAMIWAPNYGVGYPFGVPIPSPGSADFRSLDTNKDGVISDKDDMYAPYYPGDDVVDWVGMTLYHWGVSFPWFENELPPPDSFARSVVGLYQGKLPNFYQEYSVARQKPMAVPETAAFFNTQQPGPDELSLKKAWWQQVFTAVTQQFPRIKCLNWFNEFKQETIAQNNWIDWRVSAKPAIRKSFVDDLLATRQGSSHFILANEASRMALPDLTLSIRQQPSALSIQWFGEPGEYYQVYSSIDLRRWSPASERMKGAAEPMNWSVQRSDSGRVYRVTAGLAAPVP